MPKQKPESIFAGALLALTLACSANAEKAVIVDDGPKDPAPVGFKDWNELYAVQNRLNDAATKLFEAADGPRIFVDPTSIPDEGFSGIVVDAQAREVKLYWRDGRPPARIESVLAEARGIGTVRVLAAIYSRQQMMADMKRWIDAGTAASATPREDGSGIVIGVSGGAAAGPPAAPAGVSLPFMIQYDVQIGSLLPEDSDPAFTQGPDVLAPFGRQNDIAPYWGGSRFWTYKLGLGWYGGCTFGFPTTYFDSSVGGWKPSMVSANHCMPSALFWAFSGQANKDERKLIGLREATYLDPNLMLARDSVRIAVPTGTGDRIYTGAWDSSTSRGVAGARWSFVGNYVRPSGASSGEHGAQVGAVGSTIQFYEGGSLVTRSPVTSASAVLFNCVAALGDSGGPVFSYSGAADDWRVFIQGHMSAAEYSSFTYCPGYTSWYPGGYAVYYIDALYGLATTNSWVTTMSNKGPL